MQKDKIHKVFRFVFIVVLFVLVQTGPATGDDFYEYQAGFKNFIQCELTRTDAENHFSGKDFSITMVNLFSVNRESDIIILTGTVKCDVAGKYHTLYIAVGLKTLKGKQVVSYYTIRKHDFQILATELIRFPYKERCPWTRYWIDLD